MNKYFLAAFIVLSLTIFSACSEREWGGEDSSSSDEQSEVQSSSEESVEQSEEPKTEEEINAPTLSLPLPPDLTADVDALIALDMEQVPWGPGTHMDEENRPIACVSLQEEYGKYNAYFIASDEKTIYLTFDNGYENGYTDDILDTLKDRGVTATFFITLPYAKSQTELVSRMIEEGHVVANHSSDHPNFTTISPEEAIADIAEMHNFVKEEYDYEMYLFRYPEGAFSEQTAVLLKDLGYTSVFWSFAYADWDVNNQPDYATAYDKITDNLHNGAIYLLHAVSETNAQVLGEVLDYATDLGYTFGNGHELLA